MEVIKMKALHTKEAINDYKWYLRCARTKTAPKATYYRAIKELRSIQDREGYMSNELPQDVYDREVRILNLLGL
jgi:hypothetical protein